MGRKFKFLSFNNALFLTIISLITIPKSQGIQIENNSEISKLKLLEMRKNAEEWLKIERKDDFGWGSETAYAVLALFASSNGKWPQKHDPVELLSAKQLEIEILEKLIRYPENFLSPTSIGWYSLALKAICKDPRDFHGFNLFDILKNHTKEYDFQNYPENYGFSFYSFVACICDFHLHRKEIHQLIHISHESINFQQPTEGKAMALLALQCIVKERQIRSLGKILEEGYQNLGALQNTNGSFGNIHLNSLIIQGLSSNDKFEKYWNRNKGILGLESSQNKDGSFEDGVFGTVDAILTMSSLLNESWIVLLKNDDHCKYSIPEIQKLYLDISEEEQLKTYKANEIKGPFKENETNSSSTVTPYAASTQKIISTTSSTIETKMNSSFRETSSYSYNSFQPKTLTVKYSIWIGSESLTAEKHNLTIQVPQNTSFFHAMQKAAEMDPAFEFSSTLWPNGHYVHTISGHREKPVGYNYWLLYRLPNDPDPNNPPPTEYVADTGVDDLMVQNGDNYLFWFKKI